MLFSIIVPAYKVEDYIRECVDSILNQTYRDFEVILVDDGSPDKCGGICDEYAMQDSRVKVIHKKNGGLSSARNAGLKKATGDYVIFIDGDDYYYDKDCLKDIAFVINKRNSDIILIPMIFFYTDTNEYKYVDKHYNSELLRKNKDKAIKYALRYDSFKACAWDKVVKREIITDNNLSFLDGVLSEDIDWCASLLTNSKTYDCVERPVYVYRQRANSITHSVNKKHMTDILYQIKKWESFKGEYENLMYAYLAHNYVMLIETFTKVKDKSKHEQKKDIKALSWLLKYDYSLNVHKVKAVYKLLGFDITRLILKLYR